MVVQAEQTGAYKQIEVTCYWFVIQIGVAALVLLRKGFRRPGLIPADHSVKQTMVDGPVCWAF